MSIPQLPADSFTVEEELIEICKEVKVRAYQAMFGCIVRE